jgi:hypothetical protein
MRVRKEMEALHGDSSPACFTMWLCGPQNRSGRCRVRSPSLYRLSYSPQRAKHRRVPWLVSPRSLESPHGGFTPSPPSAFCSKSVVFIVNTGIDVLVFAMRVKSSAREVGIHFLRLFTPISNQGIDVYSGGARFECRAGHQLYRMSTFCDFPQSLEAKAEAVPLVGHDRSLQNHLQSIIHQSPYHSSSLEY